MIGIFLDWLFGERCHLCGHRVFPADVLRHYRTRCEGAIR